MIIRVTKKVIKHFPDGAFRKWGLNNPKTWSWKEEAEIDLTRFPRSYVDDLEELFNQHPKVIGVGVILRDLKTWKRVLENPFDVKARTIWQFAALLKEFLRTVPGHRVYQKFGESAGKEAWLAFYVNDIEYHPEDTSRDYRQPAYVSMCLLYEEFGGRKKVYVRFGAEDIRCSVSEALVRKGYYAETSEFRHIYEKELNRFAETHPKIGKQYYAVGTGTDNLDGNPNPDRWGYRLNHTIQLENDGQPTRCVVDVFYEDPKSSRDEDKAVYLDTQFWKMKTPYTEITDRDELDEIENDIDSGTEENDFIEIPVHPFCAVFDLTKHVRLRVHINYLTEYIYNRQLSDKLVLPKDLKNLVLMLMNHNALLFQDIIKGKSGGVVILLTGKPGTGKTLTAEVYAESEGRALYSVQCSQLGTEADDLENELLKAFARARRWNAVMLLDEADVYVHERGNEMTQNAIVGVFLRVLEYHASVLFLTTNRPDDVDDAIASRCIARLSYPMPTDEEQAKIWRILADESKLFISDSEIFRIVKENPNISGRDVKNLLKLGHMYAGIEPIGANHIAFVKRFKPTN
jgi:hypothetical protein